MLLETNPNYTTANTITNEADAEQITVLENEQIGDYGTVEQEIEEPKPSSHPEKKKHCSFFSRSKHFFIVVSCNY